MKWIGLAVMLSMAPFVRATVDNNNPIANSKAVVICGNARFTVLTPEMIRIEYSEKGMFEDRPTFTVVNRNLELVDFKKKEDDRFLYIQTDKVKLKYRKQVRHLRKTSLLPLKTMAVKHFGIQGKKIR